MEFLPVVFLQIISAQQLPKPSREVIDPYVEVTVLDVNAEYEDKTEVIENNGKSVINIYFQPLFFIFNFLYTNLHQTRLKPLLVWGYKK